MSKMSVLSSEICFLPGNLSSLILIFDAEMHPKEANMKRRFCIIIICLFVSLKSKLQKLLFKLRLHQCRRSRKKGAWHGIRPPTPVKGNRKKNGKYYFFYRSGNLRSIFSWLQLPQRVNIFPFNLYFSL